MTIARTRHDKAIGVVSAGSRAPGAVRSAWTVPAGIGGPVIAAGEKPWTPLGSPLVGGILVAALIFAVFCIPYAFMRLRR